MPGENRHDFIEITAAEAEALLAPLGGSPAVADITPIRSGNSRNNSNYAVTAGGTKYLLKIYADSTGAAEAGAYAYLHGKINVPALLHYDADKKVIPHAYAVVEYLDGCILWDYVRVKRKLPAEIAFETGKMCAAIHNRTYAHDALLDGNLDIREQLPKTRERIVRLLNGVAGARIRREATELLFDFLETRADLFERLEAESVLCHGDLNFSNIFIVKDRVYFIDFEFACAGSRYNDIGHFFTRKPSFIQSRIGRAYGAFEKGYNGAAASPLPDDWVKLANLYNIFPLLRQINYADVPDSWIVNNERNIQNIIQNLGGQ